MHPSCVFLTLAVCSVLTVTGLAMSTLRLTPSPDIPKWTVKDYHNNICMLMAMDATLTAASGEIVPVPQSAIASPVSGSCDSSNAYFTLSWPTIGYPRHTINILFKATGTTYKIVEVNGTEEISPSSCPSWSERSSSFPSATVGNSMTCHDYEVNRLEFHSYQFHPFAKQSAAEFEHGEECSSSKGGVAYRFIIPVAVAALIVVFVVYKLVLLSSREDYIQLGDSDWICCSCCSPDSG